MQWNGVLNKYVFRATAIGLSGAPASISAYLYNTNAVSILQFLAQLSPMPPCARRLPPDALFDHAPDWFAQPVQPKRAELCSDGQRVFQAGHREAGHLPRDNAAW